LTLRVLGTENSQIQRVWQLPKSASAQKAPRIRRGNFFFTRTVFFSLGGNWWWESPPEFRRRAKEELKKKGATQGFKRDLGGSSINGRKDYNAGNSRVPHKWAEGKNENKTKKLLHAMGRKGEKKPTKRPKAASRVCFWPK